MRLFVVKRSGPGKNKKYNHIRDIVRIRKKLPRREGIVVVIRLHMLLAVITISSRTNDKPVRRNTHGRRGVHLERFFPPTQRLGSCNSTGMRNLNTKKYTLHVYNIYAVRNADVCMFVVRTADYMEIICFVRPLRNQAFVHVHIVRTCFIVLV